MDRTPAPTFLRVKQVAKLLNVGVRTVQLMADRGQLVSIRLPNGRGDRRISLDSVKVLLKESGVEVDLREFLDEASEMPSVVLLGVPDGPANSMNLGERVHIFAAKDWLMGAAMIALHRPCVIVLDSTAIHNWGNIVDLRSLMSQFAPGAILIFRCYDDPEILDPRQPFKADILDSRNQMYAIDESSHALGQAVLNALFARNGKVPA